MKLSVKTYELFFDIDPLIKPLFDAYEYPWQIVGALRDFLSELTKNAPDGYTRYKDNILIGEGVNITKGAMLEGPLVIGKGAEIRHCAYIRGSVFIGEGAVVGNSTELKNSILLTRASAPHFNYVGDSILGAHSHMGASSICSNLKSDGKNVVIRGISDYETGMRKVGAFLGDGAEIGCGCVLNPGTVIGRATSVYPLISLRGVYPDGAIIKESRLAVARRDR